ncbi:MAG: hypothetical protein CMQ54_00230 [Gammaproteobacteria bacterium]|nr:hypothetical protein [Gammaproteobacteria bacterium]|tara:strand:+ start:183 stop:434 length:252 start_codon:yes stop_codon:yes gene_type:complete
MKHIIASLLLFSFNQVLAHDEPIGSIDHAIQHHDYIGISIFSFLVLAISITVFKKLILNFYKSKAQEELKISLKNHITNNLGT